MEGFDAHKSDYSCFYCTTLTTVQFNSIKVGKMGKEGWVRKEYEGERQ